MSVKTSIETTEVIVCGCGPTGVMLSVLLGQHSVHNIVLEREDKVNTDPRGIALDEDGIRCLQACGIYDKVFTDIGQCTGKLLFIGGTHHDLNRKPFMLMDHTTTEGGTGHPGYIFHKQPAIEGHLRAQLSASQYSDLRLGMEMTSIQEDNDWVFATYTDNRGRERTIRSRFLVGADGKTGFTRKNYLEPRGITMETVSQTSYEETWVALNWKMSLPTPESHPDFPLWNKGYTPQQVYDAFFPLDFRFLCNPERAAVCGRFGLSEDRLWRFEFVVLAGEDGTVMAGPDMIKHIVYPYITLPGARFGLRQKNIQYPDDCIKVLRSRPFRFSARSCDKWALDRVILCGDAAHVFPPFGGQGIASGFRDAISLAWRLALATRQASKASGMDYKSLLDGWYSERKQQLDRSLASTVENGNYVTESNPFKILVRDWYLWAVQLVPSWRHDLELGNRRNGMARYRAQPRKEPAFLPSLGGGICCPQVYCVDVSDSSCKVHFTDDVIFGPGKNALFQIVAFLDTVTDISESRKMLNGLAAMSHDVLSVSETTYILRKISMDGHARKSKDHIYRLAEGSEFAADDALCRGRPKPRSYDPFRISRDVHDKKFLFIRPDRFVYATCDTAAELHEVAKRIALFCS